MSEGAASILPETVFAGRRYAVLGLARTGIATICALAKAGASVVAWDRNEDARTAALAAMGAGEAGGRCVIAELTVESVRGCDGIVVSPGVPINRHPIADIARAAGVPLIGDIELFAQARPALPPHRVIGITGTNGKSTTTALIHHLLESAGHDARLGGNIGVPVLSTEPLAAGGIYVLELSSYQIDLTRSLACEIAILLNLSPDHLDRYDEGFAGYAVSKARLFQMQRGHGLAIVDRATLTGIGSVARALDGRAPVVIEDVAVPGAQADWPALQGPHNLGNAAAAVAAVRRIGLTDAEIEAGLKSFPGLPHRMERVATLRGVLFVNDSKATNPASTAPALAAFAPEDHGPRIHWIVGGLPKGDTLGEMEAHLGNVAAAYTIGESGVMFAQLLEGRVPRVTRSELMAEAVRAAAAAARPGDVVLLSPACASFDQFRDYEKRGEAFASMVHSLGEAA
ncbi:UDP-N-acetylmuramoylalanine--D-glutamate ligase [Croceicoccus sp. BE223]|nr:UDP-N-acetylmuramoyl-L-alanine--D-glutamate ligase [Croceicoccus sp. BE223]MDR7101746.1 UDP-N-acetylmuramoylalanine--D-glutamate ligase [Croceicoccus sp. BE223]